MWSQFHPIDKEPALDKMQEFASMVFSRISTSDGIPDTVTSMTRDVNELYRLRLRRTTPHLS